MSDAGADSEIAAAFQAVQAGRAAPLAGVFLNRPGLRSKVLKASLALDLDAPLAAAFRLIWADPARELTPQWRNLLRWYLVAETAAPHPARRECQCDVLQRALHCEALFAGDEGLELGMAAARAALERGGRPGLRAAGAGLLRRLEPGALPLTPAVVHAAIQAVDLRLLHALIARWTEAAVAPDLKNALDWATGLVLEVEGMSPRMVACLERRHAMDPTDPMAALRKVQIGLYHGQSFTALTEPLARMRRDLTDRNLAQALTFGFWQARMIGQDRLAQGYRAELLALDPGWSGGDTGAEPPAAAPNEGPSGADLAGLVHRARALAAADWSLAGGGSVENLSSAFAELEQAMADADLPPDWGPADSLAAADALWQIDRRDYSWCCHFDLSPHAAGAPRYGLVNLALLQVFHDGLNALMAALCRRGLEQFLQADPAVGLGLVARLLQMHSRAALEIDRQDQAARMLDLVAAAGILADVVALERDNLALARGDLSVAAPISRQDTTLHAFAPREGWSRAEGLSWAAFSHDPPVQGQFDVAWFDGQVETAPHVTPSGQVATAAIPGLRLMPEDFVIGPASGAVLRPDPYHTSAEFPWPSPWMRAAGKRAIRLGGGDYRRQSDPVLVLEAFEALRWRNYFHWMVPILSRVALALDAGLLDQRRLVVPEGLSGWMLDSLALLGLTGDRLLTVTPGQGQDFDDAVLMSSIEHLSRSGLRALRRRFLAAAGAGGDGPGAGRFLFLSRKGHALRSLINQDEVEDLAARMGFEVIAPQDLGIAGQVRVFAAARGVAGVEGAALTNTIFAPPGIGVLAIVCENDMMPIFNDLSILLGQHHRKLAGQARPLSAAGGGRLQPPYAVDLAVARRSLDWVLAGGRG